MIKKYYAFTLLCAFILSTGTFIHSQIYHSQNQGWKEPPVILKMVSVYSRYNPIYQKGMEKFADDVKAISNEQLIIEIYAAGEDVPIREGEVKKINKDDVFDVVRENNDVQMGFGTTPYWAEDKIQGSEFMYAVPFGLNAKDMYAWLHRGGGLELLREIYEQFNVIPFPVGNTGGAMGGWFNKEISKIDDFKGMNIRMGSLHAKVMTELNANKKWMPADKALKSFIDGELNAIVCLGPYVDMRYRLYRKPRPKYYYYPGWQEPGGVISLIINKDAWKELPPHLQKTIEVVCSNTYYFIYNQFEKMNSIALKELQEKEDVILKEFPPGVLDELRKKTKDVLEEEARKSSQFNKIYQSFKKFKEDNVDSGWGKIVEESVYPETISRIINELNSSSVANASQKGNNTMVISLSGDTSFAFNSATPTTTLSDKIKHIAGIIKNYSLSIKLIKVEGHTDSKGAPCDNWLMSRKRANAVVNLLKKNGIKKDLIKPVFYGDAMPIDKSKTPEGNRKNRRVAIVIEF